jgi:glycosyltransferase involved in cell wall biosynthesis
MNIAILTTFQEFSPGYSLTGIVKDQARMLANYGHKVYLYVSERYHGEKFSDDVTLCKDIPFSHLKDYRSRLDLTEDHKALITKTAEVLTSTLQQREIQIAFTHDFIFTGWFMPYGQGCRVATPALPKVGWLHWIHSIPSIKSDWWKINEYGKKHKIVYPNWTDRTRVAEQYRGLDDHVRIIPHIKDLRSFFEFSDETCRFIKAYPAVMQADVVNILPASVDRLSSKRVDMVMKILGEIKAMGKSVCLVVCNQWATGRQQKEDTNKFREVGKQAGLVSGKDMIFTSDFESPKFDVGIPTRMVRELFLCSNLFIFPTREESFGLVVPEASLAGGVLPVLNKSLQMQMEISGNHALYFDFGSYHQSWVCPSEQYWIDLATIIVARMRENEAIKTKTFMRQRYNMDYLYHNAYAPVMQEMLSI